MFYIKNKEDLIISYPRRIEKGSNWEIWQYPYIKDGVFHDNFDLAVVQFLGKRNIVTLISEHESRLRDMDYVARIQLLVHDISEDSFDVRTELVKDIFSDETDSIIDKLK